MVVEYWWLTLLVPRMYVSVYASTSIKPGQIWVCIWKILFLFICNFFIFSFSLLFFCSLNIRGTYNISLLPEFLTSCTDINFNSIENFQF